MLNHGTELVRSSRHNAGHMPAIPANPSRASFKTITEHSICTMDMTKIPRFAANLDYSLLQSAAVFPSVFGIFLYHLFVLFFWFEIGYHSRKSLPISFPHWSTHHFLLFR